MKVELCQECRNIQSRPAGALTLISNLGQDEQAGFVLLTLMVLKYYKVVVPQDERPGTAQKDSHLPTFELKRTQNTRGVSLNALR